MLKNLNETLSLISLLILCVLSLKAGLGWVFSSHRTDTLKGNWLLLKDYCQNTEE
ncbi:MAG: hypothetical protein Q4B60_04930 [Erysipelotrichaceae bacterium]|nr:hypothetical protein [Erysipelotrichaceae bacterium]